MKFDVKLTVFAVTLNDKTLLQISDVDANEPFDSFGEVDGNPDAVAFTINGVTYSAYPKDVYLGLTLEQLAELFVSMDDKQKMFFEHALDELGLVADKHTDCEACDLTKFIESEEAHYEQTMDARGDEE